MVEARFDSVTSPTHLRRSSSELVRSDASYLRGRIIGALGGMAAEQEVLGIVTTGAENDLKTATGIAKSMVGRWGMSERGARCRFCPVKATPGVRRL